MSLIIRPAKTIGGDTGRGPSSTIWGSCPHELLSGVGGGTVFFDDFLSIGESTAADGTFRNGWTISEAGTGTPAISTSLTHTGGVLSVVTGTTADDEVSMSYGDGGNFAITDGDNADAKLWFEARIATPDVVNGDGSLFIGLSDEAADQANFITDSHEMADTDFIGFNVFDSDGDNVQAGYKANGQTVQTEVSALGAITASTFCKVGFIYDPVAPPTERIKYYFNGVKANSFTSASDIAAATFPSGEEMSIALGAKTDDAATYTLLVDWIKVVQGPLS